MDLKEMRDYLHSRKVLFATNGEMEGVGSSLMGMSISTYKPLLYGVSNIASVDAEHGRFYGYSAFKEIISYATKNGFDYVIYIDTDCFIVSLERLFESFRKFAEANDCVFSGMPDGGVISHRNGNRYSINPFLSFFNIGILRNDFLKDGGFGFNGVGDGGIIPTEHTKESLNMAILPYSEWREKNHFTTPHSLKISGSGFPYQHIYTPNQKVWSFNDNALYDEPYYRIFLSVHDGTHSVEYMIGKDYVGECDGSGITTAIISEPNFDTDDNIICLHTWFSRFFSENAADGSFEKMNSDRIRSVYEYCRDVNGEASQI